MINRMSWAAGLLAAALPAAANAGTWQALTHTFPGPRIVDPATGTDYGPGGAAEPLLLTDGSVLVHNAGPSGTDGRMFRLVPDQTGSYVNGTWVAAATLPYQPFANAQAVLPDGRVIVEGGEYSNYGYDFTLTNQGAIYDPVADRWTSVAPPAFFTDLSPARAKWAPHPIGDSQSVVLPNGTFMLADKMSRQAALLDPKTLTWTETGTATKADLNDEEGWVLLPDGTVLTTDCYTDAAFGLGPYPAQPTASEIYTPATGAWASAGSTGPSLTDPNLYETGPALLRPDGTVFAIGSQGFASIYSRKAHAWTPGPTLPISPQGARYTDQDGPAALLPSGRILFVATGGPTPAGGGYAGPPAQFFETDGKTFTPEPGTLNAPQNVSGSYFLLLLPTGQVLSTDATGDVEIYTPDPPAKAPLWAPRITAVPRRLTRGATYTLSGVRLNGMSQAVAFGDESQAATNYPLVRLVNWATKHVFYARTHDHSSMAVASPATVTTQFDVPAGMESGYATISVVANGVASPRLAVIIR